MASRDAEDAVEPISANATHRDTCTGVDARATLLQALDCDRGGALSPASTFLLKRAPSGIQRVVSGHGSLDRERVSLGLTGTNGSNFQPG